MAIIKRGKNEWVTVQITPDRTVNNKSVHSLISMLAEMYKARGDRTNLSFKGVTIQEQARFSFSIHLTKETVSFQFAIPERHFNMVNSKIMSTWDKSTIKESKFTPYFVSSLSHGATMHLSKHSIYSLNTNNDSQDFYRLLLNISANMTENQHAVIDVLFEPSDMEDWESKAEDAYTKIKDGVELHKAEISAKSMLKSFISFIGESPRESPKREDDTRKRRGGRGDDYRNFDMDYADFRRHLFTDEEFSSQTQRGRGREKKCNLPVGKDTRKKMHEPSFSVWIRVVAQSSEKNMAGYLCRNICSCFKELDGDNELERKDHQDPSKLLQAIYTKSPFKPFGKAEDRMSVSELSSIIQMPEEKLQRDFDSIDQMRKMEVLLPSPIYSCVRGIPGGYVTERGKKRLFKYPVDDDDLFCTTDISIGPKGCGKSTKAVVQTVGTIECGYSVFLVDTSDGEVIDRARDALPEWMPDDHIIDLDFGNLMYPFPMNLSDVALSTRAKGDNELGRRVIANKLKDALVLFIKNISSYGEFSDRMEQYIGAAGKAVLRNPENSILEIFLALTNKKYIRQLVEDDGVQKNLQVHETLSGLLREIEKGVSSQKIDPIISRLNKLINNDFASNMFLQKNKTGKDFIDFRKWADGDKHPYFVGIRIPKDDFGASTVNMLTAFVLMKWYLAVLSRTNIPKEQRRPCSLIWDEPHTAIEAAGPILEDISAEMRKYRGRIVFLAHGPDQFGKHWSALTRGGFTLSLYRTKEVKVFQELKHVIAPFDPEGAFRQLPERYWAINKLAVRGVDDLPAFMAEMCDMPRRVKDRSYRKDQCSKQYGTHYTRVENDILQRRLAYRDDDKEDGHGRVVESERKSAVPEQKPRQKQQQGRGKGSR